MRLPSGQHLMLINPSHSVQRRTFNIAHELGHLVRGHQPVELSRVNGTLDHPRFSDADEDEAYGYGLALLIPYAPLLQFREQGASDGHIARHYKVSVEALYMRLKILGLWSIPGTSVR